MYIPKKWLVAILALALCKQAYCQPTLTANDFVCYNKAWVAGLPYADRDGNGRINANDYVHFINQYASGNPSANCDGSGTGWTNLEPLPGQVVAYTSPSGTGNCTAGSPCSLTIGIAALNAGQAQQVLLLKGSTYIVSGYTITRGGVISSYGTGLRPRVWSSDTAFNVASGVNDLTIAHLDIRPSGVPGQGHNAIWVSPNTNRVTIEGNYCAKFPILIASHGQTGGHINSLTIRRNVLVDATGIGNTQFGHGLFAGEQFGLRVEENVFDMCGRDGEQNIFRHSWYIHDNNAGTATVIGNIHARAGADSGQTRPGGLVENNLSLQNTTGFTTGGGTFRYNVAIDGRNINSSEPRGTAFEISGPCDVEYNIAAYQVSGTANIVAYAMNGADGLFRGNVAYNWKGPTGTGWSTVVQWEGGGGPVDVYDNWLVMPVEGMLFRHESRALSSQFDYNGNTLFTGTPDVGIQGYLPYSSGSGIGRTRSQWQAATGEATLTTAPPNPNATMADYLASIGVNPNGDAIAVFMAEARQMSRDNYRVQFTADGVNDWMRAKFGVPAN